MREKFLTIKNKIESFAAKPAYVFIVCMIAFVFHALAWDAAGLVLFAVTGGLFLVIFDDPRPALAVIFCTVFVISTQNSNGHYDDEIVYFFKPHILITLIVAGAFLFACMVIRCVKNRKNLLSMKFIVPFAIFAVTIFFSGINNVVKYDFGRNLIFVFGQIASYLGLYVVFSCIIDDVDDLHDYIATLIAGIAFLNILEVLYVYFLNMLPPFGWLPENWRRCMRSGYFFESTRLWKTHIVTGCGVSNTIGALLALCLPSIFYKIDHSEKWVRYEILAFAVVATIVITFSRTALAVAAVFFIVLTVRTLIKAKDKKKRIIFLCITAAVVAAIIVAGIVLVVVKPNIFELFLPKSLVMWDRFELWDIGFKMFEESPIFGVGYAYPTSNEYLMTYFQASRSMYRALLHNFFVQSLASSGIVGTLGLIVAMAWIMITLVKENYEGKFYILCFIFGFIVVTLLDIMYGVPYYVMFLILMIVIAEKSIKSRNNAKDKRKAIKSELCAAE